VAIHYFIDLDCQARRSLGAEFLLERIRDLSLADSMIERHRSASGRSVDPSEIRIRRRFVSLEGEEREEEVTAEELLRGFAPLEEFEGGCRGCPAALTGAPYSCIHSLSLPLSEAAERWLASQAAPPGTLAGQYLRRSMENLGWGAGGQFSAWREAGFLQAPAAIPLEGEAEGGLDTDSLLHVMLQVGDLTPTHCLSLLLFVRGIRTMPDGDADDAIRAIERIQQQGTGEGMPELGYAIDPAQDDDRSTLELKLFLLGAFRAFSIQANLAIRG